MVAKHSELSLSDEYLIFKFNLFKIPFTAPSPYNEHFQGDQTFGDHYDVDPAGRCTRKCLDWMYDPDEPCVINNVQGDFRNRTQTEDGKGLEP